MYDGLAKSPENSEKPTHKTKSFRVQPSGCALQEGFSSKPQAKVCTLNTNITFCEAIMHEAALLQVFVKLLTGGVVATAGVDGIVAAGFPETICEANLNRVEGSSSFGAGGIITDRIS